MGQHSADKIGPGNFHHRGSSVIPAAAKQALNIRYTKYTTYNTIQYKNSTDQVPSTTNEEN